ncbi:MAG: hypothetical protein ACKPEA_16275, partial [Planctomycetota bacterium]
MTMHALAVLALAVACSARQDVPQAPTTGSEGAEQQAAPAPPATNGALAERAPTAAASESIERIL